MLRRQGDILPRTLVPERWARQNLIDGERAKDFENFLYYKRHDVLADPCSTLAKLRRAMGLEEPFIYNRLKCLAWRPRHRAYGNVPITCWMGPLRAPIDDRLKIGGQRLVQCRGARQLDQFIGAVVICPLIKVGNELKELVQAVYGGW